MAFENKYIALVGEKENRKEVINGINLIYPGLSFTPDLTKYVGIEEEMVREVFTNYLNISKIQDRIIEFDTEIELRK